MSFLMIRRMRVTVKVNTMKIEVISYVLIQIYYVSTNQRDIPNYPNNQHNTVAAGTDSD